MTWFSKYYECSGIISQIFDQMLSFLMYLIKVTTSLDGETNPNGSKCYTSLYKLAMYEISCKLVQKFLRDSVKNRQTDIQRDRHLTIFIIVDAFQQHLLYIIRGLF